MVVGITGVAASRPKSNDFATARLTYSPMLISALVASAETATCIAGVRCTISFLDLSSPNVHLLVDRAEDVVDVDKAAVSAA